MGSRRIGGQSFLLSHVLTTSCMRRKLERENFPSARRRLAISLSMLEVPISLFGTML